MVTPASPPASTRSGRHVNALQALALLLAFALVAGLGGVLAAGLVMPAVATASAVTETSVTLFDDLPTEFEEEPLSEKSTVLTADGTVLATFFDQNRIVVSLDQVSQPMRDAVVSVEDRRFYEHGGIDPLGMGRAFVNNAVNDDLEGASTLTQQYIKNVLITSAEDAEEVAAARETDGVDGYGRKLREAKLAIALEQRLTKDEILERYLNIAQFGPSVYGVEAAGQYYFSTPASELNYLQAATIAGITQSPGLWDPERNPEGTEGRRNDVLVRMLGESKITQEEYDAGVATPLPETLDISRNNLGCMAAGGSGYFCDFVTKILIQDEIFGETYEDRRARLYRGGLTITTTMDLGRQLIAEQEVMAGIPPDDPSGVAHAVSVVEPGTGHVLAMAQNRTFNTAPEPGPGQTAVNYNTDFKYGGSSGFQPGSTFKPFTLAEWLRQGNSLNQVIDATRRDFTDWNAPCTGSLPDYNPQNSEGGDQGPISVLRASSRSVNSGYMAMANQLDLCGIFETAAKMGVHRATGEPVEVGPANVLGTAEIAPLTMAAAFATFASGGTYCDPIAIISVVDRQGEQLPVPSANCRLALEPQVANGVTYALERTLTEGTASAVGGLPGRQSAGKTGTSNVNEHTWFVGYTPQLSTAVWTGYSEGNIPVRRMTVNGTYYRNVYGSSISAPTWKRFMVRAHEGLPAAPFGAVDGRILNGVQVRVPNVGGMTQANARATLVGAGFNVRTSTDARFSQVPQGLVAATDPSGGSTVTKGTVITLFPSAGPEPRPDPPADEPGSRGGGNGRPDAGPPGAP
ncbi:penicillin-binding protein [Actinotalea sp. K2]|uniref:penicillin-binding protein n=1 Tax=Actinotalea sp. K2 TaxID=2939438 RepID=UPI0020170692|nr:penicillin-binding protein [Actinotalea sp. K2]MCL3859554.1 penicillin-binding protein [Actinotalea sp. K2]